MLVFDEPTRGVDVGAKTEIYTILAHLLEMGTGIVLISSELSEVLSLSDRLLVMFRGQVVLDGSARDLTAGQLLESALVGASAKTLQPSEAAHKRMAGADS